MTDIVERLRDQGRDAFAKKYSLGMWMLCDEAATEIERLREVARLARDYFDDFLQDEATDPTICISDEQHFSARALGEALEGLAQTPAQGREGE